MSHTDFMSTRIGALCGCLVLLAACSDGSEPEAADRSSSVTPTPPQTQEQPSTRGSGPTGTAETTVASSTPVADGTTIVTGESEYGPMLFDDTGQAIYLFDVETNSEPQCYDECEEAWPPVFTDTAPVAGDGVDASLLRTVERRDGRLQVTYNKHPLYFYAHEGKHEVLCHDVFLNGGNWYVVEPGGDAAPPG